MVSDAAAAPHESAPVADASGQAGAPAAPGEPTDAESAGSASHPKVPVDLGQVDPTELGRATRRAVARALAEDLGDRGDVTSLATVPPGRTGRGKVVAREHGVVFGVEVLLHVFEQVDTRVDVQLHVDDGQDVEAGEAIATLSGPLSSILTGERVALNFLGHLSGIATQVRRYVAAAGPDVAIRDTRKTTPGLRLLEKAAVVAGGGHNHRIGLYDALLIKDNHIVAAGSVSQAVGAGFARGHGRHIQVEVTSLAELEEALAAGARDVLLDNFSIEGLKQAVARTNGRAALEASGNVDLETVREVASTGVDRIAIGRLTHSTRWLDVALDLTEADAAAAKAPLAAAPGVEASTPEDAEDQPAADALWGEHERSPIASGPAAGTVEIEESAESADSADDDESVDPEPTDAEAPGEQSAADAAVDDGSDADGEADEDELAAESVPSPSSPPSTDEDETDDVDGEAAEREPSIAELTAELERAAQSVGDEPVLEPDPEAPAPDESDADAAAPDDPQGADHADAEEGSADEDGAAKDQAADESAEPLAGDSLFAWRDRAVRADRAPDGGPA